MLPIHYSENGRDRTSREIDQGTSRTLRQAGMLFCILLAGLLFFLLVQPLSALLIDVWILLAASV